MKTLKIALALIAMSPFALGGEPYRESSNIAQFKSDELLDWELDPSFQAQGIGCGLGKIKKNAEGKIVLQAVKRATLNLEIGSFPDKLLKDLSSSKNYKKTQDATKDFDGSSKKRFVSGHFDKDDKKIQFYILALEDKNNFAYVLITCNQGGASISLNTVKAILQSLEFITKD